MMQEMSFPTFLFQSEESVSSDNSLAFLAEKRDLKSIISRLCKQLHHPVALIDYNALTKVDSPEKLESMVEMFPMRRACSIFRKCAGESYCTQCDYFHARSMDTNKASIERHIQENLNQAPSFFYPEHMNWSPTVLEGFERPVIEYHCPMLGYRELLFPLIYNKCLYGVIFAGQIMVFEENDKEINKTISESFFKNKSPEELFKAFVKEFNVQNTDGKKLTCEQIKDMIVHSDTDAQLYDDILSFRHSESEELEYYSKNFVKYADYHSFISSVCNAITVTENDLKRTYEERRKRIIFQTLRRIADKYYEDYREVHNHTFKNRHEASTEELNSSLAALRVFAREIPQQFKLIEKILLFGDNQEIRIETSSKKRIVFTVPSVCNVTKGSFDFSLYSIDGINDFNSSLTKPEILAGLSEELPRNNSILIQCHDIAMLIVVKDLDDHIELYTSLAEAIGKELVRINSIIALCSANVMKEKYLLTLRMYRHENAHISTRLMGNIDRYFKYDGQRFLSTDKLKRRLVCHDLRNTVQLISNIADNISFVTGTGIAASDVGNDTASRFDVVDMLYKWQIMFQDELENRNLEIIVYRGEYDSSTIGYKMADYLLRSASEVTNKNETYSIAPNVITINARLFELLVYNIVDNAVKYAYIGTNIYLIWTQFENDYVLSITSYGPHMPEGDSMYGLYVRGNYTRFLQGDGLGLYVVKNIADKIKVKVSHKSERISLYNAPLIPWYIKTDFTNEKNYSKIDINEFTLHSDAPQLRLSTNRYPFTKIKESDLTPDYLQESIIMPTWKTTFRISIPSNNKKNS